MTAVPGATPANGREPAAPSELPRDGDVQETKRRATWLSVDQVRAIDHFCGSLFIMFPKMLGVAHVGSSLIRDDWRDVDLRIVMDDVDMAVLRGALDLDDLHMLLSMWGQRVTGLPIDCQLQEQSEHQREAFGPNGAPRHNWRGRDRLYANARRVHDANHCSGDEP